MLNEFKSLFSAKGLIDALLEEVQQKLRDAPDEAARDRVRQEALWTARALGYQGYYKMYQQLLAGLLLR